MTVAASKPQHILLLPGDGVGVELTALAQEVLEALRGRGLEAEWSTALVGGAAIDSYGEPLPAQTLERARKADAVFLGAVGGPKWDSLPTNQRPEKALLGLRKGLGAFANLRPLMMNEALQAHSPLKPGPGFDILIVRELIGGIYFGEPRGVDGTEPKRRAFNTMVYSEAEVERIARLAFREASVRQKRLCSVDKANVLEVSALWREVVESVAKDFPDVSVQHLYVDNAAMQLVLDPAQFDVIVTSNLFGDILSDLGAAVVGTIGALPSASYGFSGPGLFEPVHGSAPDLAGKDKVNPLATLYTLSMLLRLGLGEPAFASSLDDAIAAALAEGLRTPDMHLEGETTLASASEIARAVCRHLAS